MTQYNNLNLKLFNSQLNKLKPEMKNDTEITSNILSNVSGILMISIIFHIS